MSNHRWTRGKPPRRPSWCCSFAVPPSSPQNPPHIKNNNIKNSPKSLLSNNSNPNSPHRSTLVNRILSPGRVSPIYPEPIKPFSPIPILTNTHFKSESFEPKKEEILGNFDVNFDVRLSLKGKKGGSLVLELNSRVLSVNSLVFKDLIANYRKCSGSLGSLGSSSGGNLVRIEVPEVDNLFVFRETIELMFEDGEDGITTKLIKFGVFRCIDILEVSASIKFTRAVGSCLKYLEAVPWSEEEEEKLRTLFDKFTFDDAITKDILSRLSSLNSENSQQNLTKQLIWSIASSNDHTARSELKSLVKGLLQKSSVYESTHPNIDTDDLYTVCRSCVESLISLFQEASGINSSEKTEKGSHKPLIERISKQVDNINWVLEILFDRQSAEEFVNIWAEQKELVKMHESTSPMVRYELSRVSSMLFIGIGGRKLHCRSQARLDFMKTWFSPMLSDFGWLQRCKKGLEMKTLEDSMGHALLTLPLKHQYGLFMEWFQCFSKQGNDCPNLSKAFQIWWRRSFLKGSESHAIESR